MAFWSRFSDKPEFSWEALYAIEVLPKYWSSPSRYDAELNGDETHDYDCCLGCMGRAPSILEYRYALGKGYCVVSTAAQ